MTPHHRLVLVAAIVLWALTSGPLVAQTPPGQSPQVFRGTVTLVPADVRGLDRTGPPVTDLPQADFTVLENGVPQPIRHFSTQSFTAVAPAAAAAKPAPRQAPADTIAVQNRRVFLIVL